MRILSGYGKIFLTTLGVLLGLGFVLVRHGPNPPVPPTPIPPEPPVVLSISVTVNEGNIDVIIRRKAGESAEEKNIFLDVCVDDHHTSVQVK